MFHYPNATSGSEFDIPTIVDGAASGTEWVGIMSVAAATARAKCADIPPRPYIQFISTRPIPSIEHHLDPAVQKVMAPFGGVNKGHTPNAKVILAKTTALCCTECQQMISIAGLYGQLQSSG